MPTGTLVASNFQIGIGAPERVNTSRRVFVMSNGEIVALPQTSSGGLFFSASSAGVSWSTPTFVISDNGYSHDSVIQQAGNLYIVSRNSSANTLLTLLPWIFNTSTNAFAGGSASSYAPVSGNVLSGSLGAWDSQNSLIHVPYLYNGGKSLGVANVTAASPGVWGGATFLTSTGDTMTLWDMVLVAGTTTTLSILFTRASTAGLFLLTATYTAGTYSAGGIEVVNSLGTTPVYAAMALDNAHLPDIVYVDSTHKLQATKRTGTNIYSTAQNIASGVSSTFPQISLTPDGSGGLLVLYPSVAGQANGEIYAVQRQSGSWKSPGLFAGGDAGGYELPRSVTLPTSSRIDAIYQTGTASPFSIYYKSQSLGAAPNTPTITAPSGFITTLTPTATWTYQNTQAPGDTQGSYRRRTVRTSDSVVMFDSGQVSSSAQSAPWAVGNASDPNYVAAATLVYGVQYQDTIMVWDSILTPAQPSSFSAPQTWTPKQGPVPTITQVTCTAGNTSSSSPATIGSPDIQATVGVTQPDGDATSQYQMTLYQADGATLLAQLPWTTLSPTVASGSSFTTLDWSITGLVNGATYVLVVSIRDAVTGQIGSSVAWTIHTSWAGPAAPTGLTVTPNPVQGTNDLAWVNGANTTSNDTFYRPSGTTPWLPLSSNDLRITLSHFARLDTAYDYAVLGVAATGGVSALATVLGVTLTAKYNAYGWWLNSVSDPLGTAASLGITDGQSGATASTNWEHVSKIVRDVPRGRTKPTTDAGIVDYWQAPGRVWKVLDYDHGAAGQLILNAAYAMENAHRVVFYRDPDGDSRFVTLENVKEDRPDRSARRIFMDIVEADYTPREIFV